jgi:hypothetical protein
MKKAAITVQVHDTKHGTFRDAVFYDFPVTVGRSVISDVVLDDDAVSSQHLLDDDTVSRQRLTLSLCDGKVFATNRGITATVGDGIVMVSGVAYDLAANGNTLAVAHLRFKVAVVNAQLHDRDRDCGGVLLWRLDGGALR